MKDGFLLIDKEVDWTSRDVCNKASHILETKKVGHTGTLDPFATGLLVVAVGKASKFIPFLEDLDKTYVAELTLGVKTNTADLTGDVIEEKSYSHVTKEMINEALKTFLGVQNQVPPMTSAISVNGQKLYKLAHKGIEIERKAREITVYELNLHTFKDNKVIFSCRVSKGTYIRTLGEDIAEKLGTVGHLSALRRIKISNFSVNSACKILDVSEDKIMTIENIAKDIMEIVEVNATYKQKIMNGVSFNKSFFTNSNAKQILLVEKDNRNPLAIYELDGEKYKCMRGLWQ